MEENIPITPAVIPAKAIQRKQIKLDPAKPLTKRQKEIFYWFEQGMKQKDIALKLGITASAVSLVLTMLASRHSINRDYIKLKAINVLNNNVERKIDEKSSKDIADLVIEANKIANPVKNDVNVIDKQLNININDEELKLLSVDDKLERLRRALSEGSAN